jgi:hypothetical protein
MTTAEQNKALVRRLVEMVNHGDLGALREVASGQIAEEASRWIGPFRDSFPDFRMTVRAMCRTLSAPLTGSSARTSPPSISPITVTRA